jgi:hypothetical protein
MDSTFCFYYELDADLVGRIELESFEDGWRVALYVSARPRTVSEIMFAQDDSDNMIYNELRDLAHAVSPAGVADAWEHFLKPYPEKRSLGFRAFDQDGAIVQEYLPS